MDALSVSTMFREALRERKPSSITMCPCVVKKSDAFSRRLRTGSIVSILRPFSLRRYLEGVHGTP